MLILGGGAIGSALIMSVQKIRNQHNDKPSNSRKGENLHPEDRNNTI